jgi:hypothetical protein
MSALLQLIKDLIPMLKDLFKLTDEEVNEKYLTKLCVAILFTLEPLVPIRNDNDAGAKQLQTISEVTDYSVLPNEMN